MNDKPVAWMFEKDGAYMCIKHDNRVNYDGGIPLYTHPVKELTDEEINDAWKQSHEDGIAMQQGFTTQQHYFAHLILRKAQEK